ncbi:pseudouridine-5'-phosphate glycosidase [Cloacibacillus sp. An23]|uniref:pseudouridine-5'-phosphate glycosidase n=1 Tax=Cloacibacillus sp. An23 TaxID=1965591 RepID=UPI000B38D010|nr:pseudouridine-5'-phosphate glycosidase [Cloacibacillus sp. An23]OUO93285.1 hypothetical protein B5F39_08285 [Cloacibacillus sp. An23]
MDICKEKPGFLVETCLLTFGLASVGEDELAEKWSAAGLGEVRLCWVADGEIKVGTMEEYIPFRASKPCGKFSFDMLDAALSDKLSGALTASGTMAVCARFGVPCAVSAGIGGIGDVKGEELCPDLPALRGLPVTLVCTSPKDMLDIPATIGWLRNEGVRTLGCGSAACTGYVFNGEPVALDGVWNGEKCAPRTLILRPIAPELRLKDREILARAVAEGKEAERAGKYYHPTVNAALDRMSGGYSSDIQLDALIDNARFAAELTA